MTYYVKPNNVTYTQMCIWIDENAYKDDCDNYTLYEYLYHISRMLAYKSKFFTKAAYYDDFAILMANRIFMRFKNKKQFEENGKLTKIKSVLNYAKGILYPTKILFENEYYAQNYVSLDDESCKYDYSLHDVMLSSISGLSKADFSVYLNDIISTIKSFIYKLPHKDKVEIENIYISCILSFLNSATLSNKNLEKLNDLKSKDKLTVEHIDKFYKQERNNCVLLYHLDQSYKDYIKVILNELRHLIANDLSIILSDNDIQAESNMKNILIASADLDINSNN